MFFSSNRPGVYSERHVELLTLVAGQLSLVVEKGRLYADVLQAKADLEEANRTLSRVALLDGLTGVPNRRSMDEMLHNAWRRAIRNRTPLSLILIDIDHFKAFNDTFGHVAGDRCLVRVANEMRGTLRRPDDFLARYGGEEFLAFPASAPVEAAFGLAERLRLLVERLPVELPSSETGGPRHDQCRRRRRRLGGGGVGHGPDRARGPRPVLREGGRPEPRGPRELRGAGLVIGPALAHYRVTAAIGAGGMGEVYRATDSKLGRGGGHQGAARRASPQDPERLARFEREAQLLASLNHPGIAAIYGLEEADAAATSSSWSSSRARTSPSG